MSNEQSQLTTTRPESVKDFLALPAYKSRFEEVLRGRAPQFMAAITAVSQLPGLKDSDPKSVIAAAMVAATLDLPVNPTLGQAHIVAYGDGQGRKVAQFQIGYKGLIQLALRSGQYKRLNAGPVNGSVFKGYDMVGEPVLDWSKYSPNDAVAGYFCAFETLNGFVKVVYMTRDQAEAHARRFSKAYAKGYSTPWKTDFDSMATKTVVKAALTKWGILSVEMQRAAVHDQAVMRDVDAEPEMVDSTIESEGEPVVSRPPPPERKKKGAAAIDAEVVPEKKAEADNAAAQTEALRESPKHEVTQQEQKAYEKAAPATRQPVAQAAPAKAAEVVIEPDSHSDLEAAETPKPRSELAEGETLECEAKVGYVSSVIGKFKGADGNAVEKGVVTAEVSSPAFTGRVRCIGGAAIQNGVAVPMPHWTSGTMMKLKLVGKKTAQSGLHVSVAAWEPSNPEAV